MGEAAKREASHAKTGTKCRADNGCECEFKNILRTVEDASAAGETIYQPRPADCFECVAGRDAERCKDAAGRKHIDEKSADKDGGPHAVTQQEQSRERSSSRRPNRKREGQNLEKTGDVSRRRASNSPHHAVAGGCRVAFLFADLADGHRNLRGTEKEIREAAAEFARRPIII